MPCRSVRFHGIAMVETRGETWLALVSKCKGRLQPWGCRTVCPPLIFKARSLWPPLPAWVQDRAIDPVARELDRSHADFMRTAVSIRDEVFNAAGHAASVAGISGSEPCSKAVEEFGSGLCCSFLIQPDPSGRFLPGLFRARIAGFPGQRGKPEPGFCQLPFRAAISKQPPTGGLIRRTGPLVAGCGRPCHGPRY